MMKYADQPKEFLVEELMRRDVLIEKVRYVLRDTPYSNSPRYALECIESFLNGVYSDEFCDSSVADDT